MTKIVQKDHPALRAKSKAVPVGEIKTTKIKTLLKQMSLALGAEADGVALAAPQLGVNLRIFVVSHKVLTKDQTNSTKQSDKADLVFINPRIVKASKKKVEVEEGCLSVRWLYGLTKRSTKATVEAYDASGHKFTRHGTDLMAQIFQHEIDHLDGILFSDHATSLRELPPETN